MTVRNDITVDFSASPRIITIAAPSDAVSIQDLHDTLRTIEDEPANMAYDILIRSAGKEDLGGGVAVGITATLQNAKLAFEARPGPTYEQCSITGGNLVAVDGNQATISPIEATAFTQIVLTASVAAAALSSITEWTKSEKDELAADLQALADDVQAIPKTHGPATVTKKSFAV